MDLFTTGIRISERETSVNISDCSTRTMTEEDWKRYGQLETKKARKKVITPESLMIDQDKRMKAKACNI